ncbi:MAG: RagB/SusD family nutrient uptake outer membrane protein [Tannerellaceae bacterium]|nr:RagB/SusD family nutrient uptake outer membrane protein [Tannerellaceae bacterium]
MKNTIKIGILSLSILFGACSDFLMTDNLEEKTNETFPITAEDYDQAIAAVYAAQKSCYYDQINSFTSLSNYMDDDHMAGGRALFDDPAIRATERFQVRNLDTYSDPWSNYYTGIFRANFVLESLEKNGHNLTDAVRNTIEGQARYLRASLYFDLTRLFGEVPLKVSTESSNPERESIENCYALIASDLKKAIELFPATPFSAVNKATDLFKANKWAAQAMAGRVFLFYTGYHNKTDLPLVEGGTITREQVLGWLHEVINQSGYGLIDDFRNLWLYAMTNRRNEDDYKFARDNNLDWIGEKGDNNESIYSISFSALGENLNFNRFAHSVSCTVGGLYPFGNRGGMSAVNPKVYDEWEDADLRKAGSIWNVWDYETEGIEFSETAEPNSGKFYFNSQSNVEETDYHQKKYNHIYVNEGGVRTAANTIINGVSTKNGQADSFVGIYIMRFSDVLLMAAELGSPNAQTYFNRVRSRAYFGEYGNLSIENTPYYKPVTLANIQEERRHEFAFEGIRAWDIRRWHILEQQLALYKTDVPVYGFGIPELITVRYRPETKGLLPIPLNQINLSNGALTQNAGWDSNDAIYSGI